MYSLTVRGLVVDMLHLCKLHQAPTVNSFVLSQSYRSLNSLRISGGEPGGYQNEQAALRHTRMRSQRDSPT